MSNGTPSRSEHTSSKGSRITVKERESKYSKLGFLYGLTCWTKDLWSEKDLLGWTLLPSRENGNPLGTVEGSRDV